MACKFGLEDGRVEFDTPFADVEVAVVEDAVGEVSSGPRSDEGKADAVRRSLRGPECSSSIADRKSVV